MPCCCLKRATSCAKSDVVLSTLISHPHFLLAGNISLSSLATCNYYKEVYASGCDMSVASVFTKGDTSMRGVVCLIHLLSMTLNLHEILRRVPPSEMKAYCLPGHGYVSMKRAFPPILLSLIIR